MKSLIALFFWSIGVLSNALAQTGGSYDLSWGGIAGGGVTFSTGGNFCLGSTIGQPVALGATPWHASGNWDLIENIPTNKGFSPCVPRKQWCIIKAVRDRERRHKGTFIGRTETILLSPPYDSPSGFPFSLTGAQSISAFGQQAHT
jgi:hypothetical protein